jgi:diaminopimelate decarboxylase
VIYGHTCDGLDIVASDVIIPASIDIGDWLCFGGMGAYTHSLIS